MDLNSSVNSSKNINYYKSKKSNVIILYLFLIKIQHLKFYNIFKKEISIDHEEDLSNKERLKKNLEPIKPIKKSNNKSRSSSEKKNNLISLNKNRHNIIFKNKYIVINDITKNYDSSNNKSIKEKKKISIINKLANDFRTINDSKNKYEGIITEAKHINKTLRDSHKLNSELKNDIKITKSNRSNLKPELSKKILKPSINNRILESMGKNSIIKNKKIGFGDSYEFFTFNNYNSNFTYNNLTENENILKDNSKKAKKIIVESLSNQNVINKFKSINPSTVRNNIIGGVNKFLNKNKKLTNPKNQRKKDKNFYAIKIQKIFRGYNYRKNNQLDFQNNNNNRISSNYGIYIRKKIINSKKRLNTNLNNTEKNLTRNLFLKGRKRFNLNNSQKEEERTINTGTENEIQEIIIDKNKILNVLNPIIKANPIKEIKINNYYSFRNFNCNRKYKLIKYFCKWKNMFYKKLIIHRLIQYIKNKRNNSILINNKDLKLKFQNNKGINSIRFYRRTRFNNNFI